MESKNAPNPGGVHAKYVNYAIRIYKPEEVAMAKNAPDPGGVWRKEDEFVLIHAVFVHVFWLHYSLPGILESISVVAEFPSARPASLYSSGSGSDQCL